MVIAREGFFSIPPSCKLWILILAYHLVPHFILEKKPLKNPGKNPEFAEMRSGDVILTLQ